MRNSFSWSFPAFSANPAYLELAQVIGRHICKLGLAQAFLIHVLRAVYPELSLAGMTCKFAVHGLVNALEAIQALFQNARPAFHHRPVVRPHAEGYHPSFKIKASRQANCENCSNAAEPGSPRHFQPSATRNHHIHATGTSHPARKAHPGSSCRLLPGNPGDP